MTGFKKVNGFALSFVFALCFVASTYCYGKTLEKIRDTGTLRIGIEGTYEPFNFIDENGTAAGFDVDIARYVASRLGAKPKFITTKWPSLIGGLKSDKFDVIIADMTITEKREKSVDFTKPYNATGAVLICRSDEKEMYTRSEAQGARVGAGAGTTYADVAASIPDAKVRLYDDFPAYVRDLMSNRLDFIVNAKALSEYVIEKHDYPLHICSDVLNKSDIGYIGMAVEEGNHDLRKALNNQIRSLFKSGRYLSLYHKWFGDGTPLLLAVGGGSKG